MIKERQHRSIHLALFGTALMWGLNVSAVKALTLSVDVMLVASLCTVLAATALTLLMLAQPPSREGWTPRMVAWGLLGAVLMVYANQALFATAMQRTSATNAALIMALAPFVSSCLEGVLFRKRLVGRQLAGIALAMTGVGVVIVKGQGSAWTTISSGELGHPLRDGRHSFAASRYAVVGLTPLPGTSPPKLPFSLAVQRIVEMNRSQQHSDEVDP